MAQITVYTWIITVFSFQDQLLNELEHRECNGVLAVGKKYVYHDRMVAPILSQNFTVNLYLVLAVFVLDGYKKEPLKIK